MEGKACLHLKFTENQVAKQTDLDAMLNHKKSF